MFSPGQEYEAMQHRTMVLAQAERYRTIARQIQESRSRVRPFAVIGEMAVAASAGVTRFLASRLQRAAMRVEKVSVSLEGHHQRSHSANHAA